MYQNRIIIIALISSILLVFSLSTQAGKMYRWEDDQGNVHYSDKVPPEHVQHARTRLNKRGIEVKKIGAAKTPEELAKEAEIKRLQLAKKRLIEEQRAQDRVLLRTFRSEDDITMTQDGKLSSLDNSILIIRTNIRRLKLRLSDMQHNAANRERRGKKVSKNMLKDIEATRKQLKDSYAVIIRREQDKEEIAKKYNADLARFQQLKNLNSEANADKKKEETRSLLLETVVVCEDNASCDRAWKLAETYTREHSTTRMQMLARSIIMTAAPLKDKDISITVSRIREPKKPGARLFMDLQCKGSPRGKEFCNSETVNKIRAGFRSFLSEPDPLAYAITRETVSALRFSNEPPIDPGVKP
ncbi:MAG: DUF4124 domain-containing protein [Gammaproteobacteria bacterium]|nr:DUF4124 domain-containing protein [Gammaproteobacteria bacterium]